MKGMDEIRNLKWHHMNAKTSHTPLQKKGTVEYIVHSTHEFIMELSI